MATIGDVLAEVDELMPHNYDDSMLVKWLSNLELKIVNELFRTHKLAEDEAYLLEFEGYDDEDSGSELLVKEPYSELYRYYLMAKICFANQETDRYTNEMLMFNAAYQEFANYWNQTHMPLSKPLAFF